MGSKVLNSILSDYFGIIRPDSFSEIIKDSSGKYCIAEYISELSLIELTCHKIEKSQVVIKHESSKPEVNPTIELIYTKSRISILFQDISETVLNGEEWVLIWKDLKSNEVRVKSASPAEIYAIKIVLEDIPLSEAAKEANLKEIDIKDLLLEQSKNGLIIYP